MKGFIVLCVLLIGCQAEDGEKSNRKGRDSYLDAYKISHVLNKNINDRDSKSGLEEHGFGGYPAAEQPVYGPPHPVYGPPQPMYGPPSHTSFGPPQHIPFGMPHTMLSLLDKLHLKLDIYTILKIILKLVIFKKIVSFIALICLLLFIPKFKMDKEDSDDDSDMRSLVSKSQADQRINNLAQYVLGAIENFPRNLNNDTCDNIYCRTRDMFRDVDAKYSYQRLLKLYTKEETV